MMYQTNTRSGRGISASKMFLALVLSLVLVLGACSAENASVEAGKDVLVLDWVEDGASETGLDACAPKTCDPEEAPELVACERWAWDEVSCDCAVLPAIIDAACDDGDRCTVEDRCTAGGACAGQGIDALCDELNIGRCFY